jgi:hypothetical protein
MRNPFARAICRLAATAAAAFAFYRYSWMPEHANHVLKFVQTRTGTALDTGGDRAIFAARDNIAFLQTITNACQLSVDYHLLYAVNDRILGRNDDAIEHYTAAKSTSTAASPISKRGSSTPPPRTSRWRRDSIRYISTTWTPACRRASRP